MLTIPKEDQIEKLGFLALGSRLKRLSDVLMHDVKKIYKDNNIDFEPRWFTLFTLIKESPGISLTDASNKLRVSHAAISQSANQMAKNGIIELAKSNTDERSKTMTLTKHGEQLAVEMADVWEILEASVRNIAEESHFEVLEMLNHLEESLIDEPLSLRAKKVAKQRNYDRIIIIDFDPNNKKHLTAFADLNIEWLEKYFIVEEADKELFNNPQKNVLDNDGSIIFALLNNKIVGTGAIFQKPEGHYELGKICVTDEYKGRQIGKKITKELIKIAQNKKLDKIYLVSNTILSPALNLYKKLGFVVNNDLLSTTEFERTNIAMELDLKKYYD